MADYANPLNTKLDANQVLIRSYDEVENALRVNAKVTATIGSVDVIIDAASGDNIAISDGVDTLAVNSDGSINVVVQDITLSAANDSVSAFIKQSDGSDISEANPLPVSFVEEAYTNVYSFNQITAVPMGIETNIVTYTVPIGKTANLTFSEFGGTNIATFNLYVGASLINRKRTFYGNLNKNMEFKNKGFTLTSGQVVTLKVIHARPSVGDFEGSLQIKESV